jgi:hypothetical protein
VTLARIASNQHRRTIVSSDLYPQEYSRCLLEMDNVIRYGLARLTRARRVSTGQRTPRSNKVTTLACER